MKKYIPIIIIILSTNLYAQCQEDLNGDGIANVVDIVSLVNFVLSDEVCEEIIVDECGIAGGNNFNIPYGFALRSSYIGNSIYPGNCVDSSMYDTWEEFDLNCPEYYKEIQCQIDNNQFNLTLGQQLYFYIYELDENGNYTVRNIFSESFEIDTSDNNIISIEYCEEEQNWNPGESHPCAGADFIDWGTGLSGSSDFFLSALNVGQTTFVITLRFDNYSDYVSLPITVNVTND
tara:strand:- start:265 stop:963 length:699 start_codon:yes stop_codon:yes gene_type:complete